MKTKDWESILDARFLLIGEHSTLQWKDEIIEHAMFLDYYFNKAPYDLGERSRYSEARNIFTYLKELTRGKCTPERVYGTLMCNEILERPPKGKHTIIPMEYALEGIERIKSILKDNPTIKYIFVMGMQPNYYMQRLGFYNASDIGERFMKGAEPSRIGIEGGFYKPVNAKPFRELCFKPFKYSEDKSVTVIPILPHKNFPLYDTDLKNFGTSFIDLQDYFKI